MTPNNKAESQQMCLSELSSALQKQKDKLMNINQHYFEMKNIYSNIYQFYGSELDQIRIKYQNILTSFKDSLEGCDEQTKKIPFPLMKENVLSLKEILLQIAQIAHKLNLKQEEMENSIKSEVINKQCTQLLEQLRTQQHFLKECTLSLTSQYLNKQNQCEIPSQINSNSQHIQQKYYQIKKGEQQVLELEKIKENIQYQKTMTRQKQLYWQNYLDEFGQQGEYKQCDHNNNKNENPFCIVINDSSNYVLFQNRNINEVLILFKNEIEERYPNYYSIFDMQQISKQVLDVSPLPLLIYGRSYQYDAEKKFLNLMDSLSKLHFDHHEIHFFLFGVSSKDNNQNMDLNLVKQLKETIQQNNQIIKINIIDNSFNVPNYSTMVKLYQSLYNEDFNCSIVQYKLFSYENPKNVPKCMMNFLCTQVNTKLIQNERNNQETQKSIRVDRFKNIHTRISQLGRNEASFVEQLKENKQNIEDKQNIIKNEYETLFQLQDKNNLLKNQLKLMQFNKQNEEQQLIEQIQLLGQNNEIFIKIQEIHSKISVLSKEFLAEKEIEKNSLIENLFRLMKYLNRFIISLNFPKDQYLNLLILQVFIMKSKSENMCLEYSSKYMLNELNIEVNDTLMNTLEKQINLSDILQGDYEECEEEDNNNNKKNDKIHLLKIIKIINQLKMRNIFSIKKIKSKSNLIEKLEIFQQFLDTECSQ